jgi:surface antigen
VDQSKKEMTVWAYSTVLSSRSTVRRQYGAQAFGFKTKSAANLLGTICISLSISACSLSAKPTAALEPEPELVTGSIAKSVEPEGIDPTDAETIKTTVANAETTGEGGHLLAWSNPETGSSGTITAIDRYIGTHGQSCKKFRTTVDSFMGIALYNGETCELKQGFWVLSWFIRDAAE